MPSKFKEEKYIIMALLLVPVMIFGSLLVKFDIMDAFYLFIIIVSVVWYIRCE